MTVRIESTGHDTSKEVAQARKLLDVVRASLRTNVPREAADIDLSAFATSVFRLISVYNQNRGIGRGLTSARPLEAMVDIVVDALGQMGPADREDLAITFGSRLIASAADRPAVHPAPETVQ